MRDWFVELRLNKGLSQTEVAIKTGIDKSTICKYEKGDRQPTVENAKKLGKLLKFNWTKFYQ